MRCWEFHHAVRGKKIEWLWRVVNKMNGAVLSESEGRFKSSVDAFEDAKKHGFDQDLHEWYLAASGDEPCTKIKSAGNS